MAAVLAASFLFALVAGEVFSRLRPKRTSIAASEHVVPRFRDLPVLARGRVATLGSNAYDVRSRTVDRWRPRGDR
jgi:hypothetical protein